MASLLANYLAGLSPALANIYRQRFVLGQSQEKTSLALGLSRSGVRNAEKKLCGGLRRVLVGAGIFLPGARASSAQRRSSREEKRHATPGNDGVELSSKMTTRKSPRSVLVVATQRE